MAAVAGDQSNETNQVIPRVSVSPSVRFGREVVELALDYYRHRYGALDFRVPPNKPEDKQLFRLASVLMRREGK